MADVAARDDNAADNQALLRVVAEELKLPLLHIARASELSELTGKPSPDMFRLVQESARSALTLVDSYILGLELAQRQQSLELEPISTSSVLYDVAQSLHDAAKRYHVNVELQIEGSYGPVMAHRSGLQAALVSLGMVFLEAQPRDGDKQGKVILATHRASRGIITGIYSDTSAVISPAQLRAASGLRGQARQPLSHFSATGTAGIFVASNILQSMAATLRTARHHKQAGLAAVLQLSRQLQLV